MEKELRALGLSNYESKALNLLFSKRLTIREISKEARIPFGKVYSVIKGLKERGVLKETNSRPKCIYVENASEIISKLINERKEQDRLLMDQLRQKISRVDKAIGKPTHFFQIGTSVEDNKEIQLRTFNEAKESVLQILNIQHKPKSNRESKTLWEKAIIRAAERGVTFKAIYPTKTELPWKIKRLNKEQPQKFQIRRLDTDFVRCDIIDDDKVLIKLVHSDPLQFGGVLFIESEKLNENIKRIFYELWEQAR
jgi:sugar-specific transcriptional regulator TrmB